MTKQSAGKQTNLFYCPSTAVSPRSDAAEQAMTVSLDEATANVRAFLAARSSGAADTQNGIFRSKPVHLPDRPEGPEIYALCPGCELHPGGGIFPASELIRVEGCPTGDRIAAGRAQQFGEGECRGADWEGAALPGAERPDTPFPFLSPISNFLGRGRAVTASGLAATAFVLTAPGRLCSALGTEAQRRIGRAWYFHRRRAICRDRLSRIASNPSWTS